MTWNEVECRNLEEVRLKHLSDGSELMMVVDHGGHGTASFIQVTHVRTDGHVRVWYNGRDETESDKACREILKEVGDA